MEDKRIVVFADGAAKGNPGPGGWGALVITPDQHVLELGAAAGRTTNNRMELTAVIEGLAAVCGVAGSVLVYTDSTYVVQGITRWIRSWKQRGWKTSVDGPVLNRDLWEMLDALVAARGGDNAVSWHHVPGHSGIAGNERADCIADSFAGAAHVALYDGPLAGYSVSVFPLPDEGGETARRSTGKRRASKGPAYSYLSLVDGQLMRHATWAECEQRVRGRAGARFKKALSAGDEAAILRSWGLRPDDA